MGPANLRATPALRVDEELLRDALHAVVHQYRALGVAARGMGYVELLDELLTALGRVPDTDTQKLNASFSVLFVHAIEYGSLLDTRRAPGCPEIHKRHISPEVAKSD